jgi:tRNA threonylcarbamoyladenosine biosynthesis protein TsaB
MRVLAIDCATEACSVALFDGNELAAGDMRMLGRGHAEHLVPMIAALPQRGRAERVAVSLGPGSFTGVRIGIAAARALALAWNAEALGYPTLALVAAMARESAGARPAAIAMTGGHGEWFTQGFDADGQAVRPLASQPPETAADQTEEELVVGTQATALVERRGYGEALEIWPDARQFTLLPDFALQTEIAALYGRGPDARLPGDRR